jgi:mannose-1-phosphate guanylyltransferase
LVFTGLAMTAAMILSAGYGTRLRPLTDERPKPLVPVGDRPLIVQVACCLRQGGFEQILINTHHRSAEFREILNEYHLNLHVVHEPKILGTAGGIAGARFELGGEGVIAWNGDVLADPPLAELAVASRTVALTLAVQPRAVGEGTVGISDAGAVVRLRGERFGTEASGGDYIGVAALSAEAVSALPPEGCLIGDYALPLLRGGGSVATLAAGGDWSDIGTLEAYHAVNLRWLDAHGDDEASWRGAEARVAPGVAVRRSAIGRGALVEGRGLVERVVAWPGARFRAPLSDAVVTSRGTVVPVTRGSQAPP